MNTVNKTNNIRLLVKVSLMGRKEAWYKFKRRFMSLPPTLVLALPLTKRLLLTRLSLGNHPAATLLPSPGSQAHCALSQVEHLGKRQLVVPGHALKQPLNDQVALVAIARYKSRANAELPAPILPARRFRPQQSGLTGAHGSALGSAQVGGSQ